MIRSHRCQAIALRTAVLIAGLSLGGAAAAIDSPPAPVGVLSMSPGRFAASLAMLSGLTAAISGARALARGSARRAALVAVGLGPIGLLLGAVVAATAQGGVGTGGGFGGAVIAMVIGLLGTVLGGVALARARRHAGATRRLSA